MITQFLPKKMTKSSRPTGYKYALSKTCADAQKPRVAKDVHVVQWLERPCQTPIVPLLHTDHCRWCFRGVCVIHLQSISLQAMELHIKPGEDNSEFALLFP